MNEKISLKRMLSSAAALAVSASTLLSAFNVQAAFSDVPEDYSYKKAITTLSKLNVIDGYEDGTFGPNKDITRAEFTKLIVYMLGYGNISTTTTQFNDLAADHWANANIATAYDLGIVNGYSDTEFGPDNAVTYEQALKMVVCALGYQNSAEAMGGYPDGYIAEAVSLKLTDGITASAYTDNASRGLVAQVMYNALEIDMYELNGNKYVSSGKNLLNDYLDTYIIKGTVVGVEDSVTIDCQASLNPGFIAIDEATTGDEYVIDYTQYTTSLAAMTEYLGKTVQIYYRKDGNSEDLFLIDIDNETYKNSELSVMYYDVESFGGNTFKYYVNGTNKKETVKLDPTSLTIRYNGKSIQNNVTISATTVNAEGNSIAISKDCTPSEALAEWLNPDSDYFIYGTIKFIDTGSTGKYNIVDIYDYDTIVANASPSASDYRISDKTITGNYLILDPDSVDYTFSLTKNNTAIATTSIAAGDVINYAKSLDSDDYYYTVYDTAKSVKGTITSLNIGDTADEKTLSIDNVEYRVTDRFLTYMKNKEQVTLETGSVITAYLDIFGSLEWGTISKSTTYYPYAYIIDAAQDGEDYYLKMFAPTNGNITSFTSSTAYSIKSYKIADSPKLNSKKSSPEAIIAQLAANAAAANLDTQISGASIKTTDYNQLVRILFSGNEIANIVIFDTANDGNRNSDTSKLVRFQAMNPETKYYVTSSSVKNTSKSTGTTMYSIKTTTPLFVIPKDRTDTASYSLKSAITTNSMASSGTYYVDAYDVDDAKYPACLLVYNSNFKSGTAITYSTAYRLIYDKINQEVDSDGDVVDKLYTYNSATTKSSTTIASSPENDFSRLGKGDIVLVGSNSDKELDTYMQAQDYDEIKAVLGGETVLVTDDEGNEKYERFNWTAEQEQTEENNWQKYKFDFRYPKTEVTDLDDYWVTGGNYTGISSRAFMCNVLQVLDAENLIYVTPNGFDESGNLPSDYTEIKVSSSTKIIRYDSLEDEFTPYAEGTESTALAITDLKGAEDYGDGCSKILLTYVSGSKTTSSATPTAKFIVIYQ
ncbi:MAG: S-layer homology domain-containing protein [Candidatus Ornithomonoglobus sp.]